MDSTTTYDRDIWEDKLEDTTAPPCSLPVQFLEDITCSFSRDKELGRGGYGVVYKGVLRCGKVIAVKKIFDIHLVEDDQFHREVIYLMDIKHQNIVQLVGYCAESSWEAKLLPSGIQFVELAKRLLCFEYVCNGSLDKYISDASSGLNWYERFEIIKGICSGLHFLHEKYIVHLDLKPKNILMDASMMPKVADFGLSRLLGAEKSRTVINGNLVGTLGYMAPEFICQGVVSSKSDIFSFGVIIIEIVTGCKDYPLICTGPYLPNFGSNQSNEISLQQYIENVIGRWGNIFQEESKYSSPEICTQQVKDCITIALKCIDHDSSKRPKAWDIFQMLSSVESTNCHTKDIGNSLIYQAPTRKQQGKTTMSDTITYDAMKETVKCTTKHAVSKVITLMEMEWCQLSSLHKDIDFMRDELKSVHALLVKLGAIGDEDDGHLDVQVCEWRDEVHRLSADIAACVDYARCVEDGRRKLGW